MHSVGGNGEHSPHTMLVVAYEQILLVHAHPPFHPSGQQTNTITPRFCTIMSIVTPYT
ncbi:hypothetical protein CVT25_012807 [Psilocybe cyanescens]|uniref:Uncharacterized protein n=1 Tax=Psilocybe cyanescens TaxID=93625 RepID=A0A409XLN9_PSICY|nr:hypothetical protein CVT25_012807 [Psilocybe cyanescens]